MTKAKQNAIDGGLGEASLPQRPERKWLQHEVPSWVTGDSISFITVNCQERGRDQLCTESVAERLLDAVNHYHGKRWWAHLWFLMPDHIHALLSFPSSESMTDSMTAWKRFTARNCHIMWQDRFFDHRLRADESFVTKAEYIRQNPVRRGLVKTPMEWPHVFLPKGREASPMSPSGSGALNGK